MRLKTDELVRPSRTVNFTRILPLFDSKSPGGLLTSLRAPAGTLIGRRESKSLLSARPAPSPATRLSKLPTRSLSLEKVQGTLSPIAGTSALTPIGRSEMDLPLGVPRFVNAATLKKMLRAKRSDLLLIHSGEVWSVVEDSDRIDLYDDSVEFRLGAIQIFS